MKKLLSLALLIPFGCTPAVAGPNSQAGWSHERTCFKSEYREEYIPGTENDPGYVKSWKETLEVPLLLDEKLQYISYLLSYNSDMQECLLSYQQQ